MQISSNMRMLLWSLVIAIFITPSIAVGDGVGIIPAVFYLYAGIFKDNFAGLVIGSGSILVATLLIFVVWWVISKARKS